MSNEMKCDGAPNLLLIGAPRCGSTALANYLGSHPEIFVTNPKEPHFLAMHGMNSEIKGIGSEPFSKNTAFSLNKWHRLFPSRTHQYLCDASVSTISYPNTSIENIKNYCPTDTKILVILRNPTERAYSSYMYCKSRGWDAGSFEHCLRQEMYRVEQNWQHLWFLKYLGDYESRLAPFYNAFSEKDIFIVIAEELAIDPQGVMNSIFSFLKLDSHMVQASEPVNQSGLPKSKLIQSIFSLVSDIPGIRSVVKTLTTIEFREKLRSKNLEKVSMNPNTRQELDEYFAESRKWVKATIGRDLVGW